MKWDKPPQQGVRSDLADIVRTHFSSKWQRPIGAHSAAAFDAVRDRVQASKAPLIIDSCCGTGDSTRYLAATFADALVLGVDKSAHRLARHRDGEPQNYIMLRADVNDFWRLAVEAHWRPVRHYLLYPNPYPKAAQVRKRWYASPAFPTLIKLGGLLTVRTNWALYAEEFTRALAVAGCSARRRTLVNDPPISAFETKYQERGHDLFEVVSYLNDPRTGAE
jgi:tRNA G46 methylase TrmB